MADRGVRKSRVGRKCFRDPVCRVREDCFTSIVKKKNIAGRLVRRDKSDGTFWEYKMRGRVSGGRSHCWVRGCRCLFGRKWTYLVFMQKNLVEKCAKIYFIVLFFSGPLKNPFKTFIFLQKVFQKPCKALKTLSILSKKITKMFIRNLQNLLFPFR